MARLSEETKEKILADFHTGQYTVRRLADKYGVSKTTVSNITKGLEPKHKEKVDTVAAVFTELAQESGQEVDAVHKAIDERTKHLIFFQKSALKNQTLANKFLSEKADINTLRTHAEITAKNKQAVLGKDAETQVNITNTNAQQNNFKVEWE